nr:integrase, catalytic region, zinc finger, CCHC-type, peptidase aspartic, catalytic [Tanacetum cinerariifolium]
MHNNIMAAGLKDHPPMLAMGRYPQWRSRFLRYIDTRPNGDALRKCILNDPYIPTTVLVQAVDATDDSPAIPEHATVKTPMNMSPANKAHFKAEKEAIHLILTGIGDEIYSTVDACQTAQEILSRFIFCIIDLGCSKHMTGNRTLLLNFVEKFLGMVRFGNNHFAVIAGYGDVMFLLNDYDYVGKLKVKGDIRVFVEYVKDSAAFGVYNKRTHRIYESVNVNFDEILEMASKQFNLEPGLSNLNETRKSLNPTVSQVEETSKKDLEDLFQNFYDEYFNALKISKSPRTNVETSNNE